MLHTTATRNNIIFLFTESNLKCIVMFSVVLHELYQAYQFQSYLSIGSSLWPVLFPGIVAPAEKSEML